MKILFCNIGEAKNYDGSGNDRPHGGGSYNNNNIGFEANNFTNHNGTYYGYVESTNKSIAFSKHFNCAANSEYVDNILVVWVVKKKYIVGYYKDARVYRKHQHTSDEISAQRIHSDYNITSKNAILIPEGERTCKINFPGRNVWYGNSETIAIALEYINDYDNNRMAEINEVDNFEKPLIGLERETIVKQRVNQSKFREMMMNKHKRKCSLCGITLDPILIASHIKPWSKSDENEKISQDNGLLLCPNHDKLFDLGYITFDNDGKIIISEFIDEKNRNLLNIIPQMKIDKAIISNELRMFLNYHRCEIFKKK